MLILLPPSEGKTHHGRGRPIAVEQLSFPELTQPREQLLDALAATSARPDAMHRLGAPEAATAEVARNITIRDNPTMTAQRLYSGVLYGALDLESLDGAALRRARRWIVVTSALFGAVRLADRLPAYRMSICANLDGVDGLERFWRPALAEPLAVAAGNGVVVDCRSSSYASMWRPHGQASDRWVLIRVPGASHFAKHTRGLVARHLCVAGSTAKDVPALALELARAFEVLLHEPARPGKPWVLDVMPPS